jgi:hypothetical protein
VSEPARRSFSNAQIGAVVGAIALLMLVGGWFLLISPKRSQVSKLEDEIAATQQQLETTRAAAIAAKNAEPIRYADLFRLAKAMPEDSDHSGIVLELNRVASDSGIRFDEIVPGATQIAPGFRTIPIELKFEGNFFNLSDFLYRLRNLVGVENGRLTATGRLFSVDRLIFAESERGFPQITATLTVSAFLYGSAPATSAPPTTTTPTTTSTDTGAVAAPAP